MLIITNKISIRINSTTQITNNNNSKVYRKITIILPITKTENYTKMPTIILNN